MSRTRRDFIKTTAATAAGVPRAVLSRSSRSRRRWPHPLQTLRPSKSPTKRSTPRARRGASYADVRVGRYRRQIDRHARAAGDRRQRQRVVRPRRPHARRRLLGLRRDQHDDARRRADARRATPPRMSRAARIVQTHRVELAPVTPVTGTWMTPVTRDPLDVPLEEKVALLLAANEAALKVPTRPLRQLRRCSCCARSRRSSPPKARTSRRRSSASARRSRRRRSATAATSRSTSEELAPRGQGWEYIESLDMPGNAERWASLAAEKLTAKSVEAGPVRSDPRSDEPLAHDSRVDRPSRRSSIARSATRPTTPARASSRRPRRCIGKLRYGPDVHEHPGRSHAGRLARARGVGRRGRAGRPVADHREGHLQGLPDDARAGGADSEAHRRRRGRTAARSPSRGTRVQFQRMPNISLLPGERDISARRHRRRHRPRHRHQESRLVVDRPPALQLPVLRPGVLRSARTARSSACCSDVAYQSNTPVFWNSMDMIGGKSSYWLGGVVQRRQGRAGADRTR